MSDTDNPDIEAEPNPAPATGDRHFRSTIDESKTKTALGSMADRLAASDSWTESDQAKA